MQPIAIACRKCLAQKDELCDPTLTIVGPEGFHAERVWDAIACGNEGTAPTEEQLHTALLNSNRF